MTDEFDDRSASAPQGAGAGGARTGWTPGGGWGGDDVDDENWDDWDDIELSDAPVSAEQGDVGAAASASADLGEADAEPVSAPGSAGGNDLASAAAAWLMKREPAAPRPEDGESVADDLSAVESAGAIEADDADADDTADDAADEVDAPDAAVRADAAAEAAADEAAADEAAADEAAADEAATDDAGDVPVVVPELPKLTIPLPTQPIGQTGHRAVDEALRSLDNAAGLPVAEQVAAFEAAHRTLRETLSTIDEA